MRRHILVAFAVCGIFARAAGKHIPSFAGPYTVTMRYAHNRSDEYRHSTGKFWAHVYGSQPKPKQEQYVWGSTYSSVDFTDETKMEVRMSQWANNQWKRNAFVMHFGRACSDTLAQAKFIVDVFYGYDVKKCPIPKFGLRENFNQTTPFSFPNFPVMPYGRYLFTVALYTGSENIGVLVADVSALPKI